MSDIQPCPCGFFTDPQKESGCTPLQIQRYRSRVSGPLLDRIDIQIEVPTVRYQELASRDAGELSTMIRQRINGALAIQLKRFEKGGIHANAQMGTKDIKRFCAVKERGEKLLEVAINKLGLSARAYSRILKVGCTIADLEGSDETQPAHVSEAIQYRVWIGNCRRQSIEHEKAQGLSRNESDPRKPPSITDPLSHTTNFGRDAKGNLTSVTNPLNQATTIAYNTAGQPISVTDPLNNTTQFTYDFGELVAVTDPLGNSTTRFIDGAGRLVSLTNPLGNLTRYDYDVLNRLTKVTDPLNGLTQFGYDPNGNLLSVTDAKNNVTEYIYNNMDRLETRKDGLLRPEGYLYDENGNLSPFTDRKSQVTTYTYDALNRRSRATYADTSFTDYTSDKGNRLTEINDSISGTITRTYDGLDRLKREVTPQGQVDYTYDAASRRETMTVFGQPMINYSYDDANRVTQITQGASTVSFTYDAAGRRQTLTLPNGVLVDYDYDNASRVTGIAYKQGQTVLGNLTYEYDKAGNRTKTGGSFARSGHPQAVTSTAYNAANHQTTFGERTLAYDNNGNLTSISNASGTTLYTWNTRNQLTGISGPGMTASFVYDGLGRREKKTINGSLTEFLFDGVNPVQETSGATVLANILGGLGIDEFFTRTDVPAAVTRHVLPDALGSALALADAAGTVQTEYTYEPFGRTTATGASNTNPFQYTGRENDGTTLYYYRFRYYHPGLQRFISEDPIEFYGGDINLYNYVGNNPTLYVDPWGLEHGNPLGVCPNPRFPSTGACADQGGPDDYREYVLPEQVPLPGSTRGIRNPPPRPIRPRQPLDRPRHPGSSPPSRSADPEGPTLAPPIPLPLPVNPPPVWPPS